MENFDYNEFEKDELYLYINNNPKEKIDHQFHLTYDFFKLTDNYFFHLYIDHRIISYEYILSFDDIKANPNSFVECILDVLTSSNEKYLVLKDNILLADYRESILKTDCLELKNMCLSKIYLELIKKYFRSIKCINFYGCTIKSDCDFSIFQCELEFKKCTIENINSLNIFNGELYLNDNIIKKLYPTTIYSKFVKINNMNDTELFNFLSVCKFPLTNSLIIENNLHSYEAYDTLYKKSLIILPYSCPNIESLTIEGSIYSTDFLYCLNNLKKVEINTIDDSIGVYKIINPNITSPKELENIKKKYPPISNGKTDSDFNLRVSMYKAVEDIMKSKNNFRYSSQERDYYLGKRTPIININNLPRNKVMQYYYIYDSTNKVLSFKTEYDTFMSSNNRIIFNNYYIVRRKNYQISEIIGLKEDIPIAQKLIYSSMGVPIIFEEDYNPDYDYSYEGTLEAAIFMFDYFKADINNHVDDDREPFFLDPEPAIENIELNI